jgi:hypothetical protein
VVHETDRKGEEGRRKEMRNENKILIIKSEGKRSHGRSRCRWVGKIKTDLR